MRIRDYSKMMHDELGAGMVYLAPLLAPMPSAWAIYGATGSPVLALAIEGLGFSATSVALRAHSERRHGAGVGLFRLALGLCTVYGVAVLAILLGKDVLPVYADYRARLATLGQLVASIGTLSYPLLTAVGAGVYGLTEQLDNLTTEHTIETSRSVALEQQELELEWARKQQELELERARKQQELDQAALDKEAAREAKRLQLSAKLSSKVSSDVSSEVSKSVQMNGNQPIGQDSGQIVDTLLDIWSRDQGASLRDVARMIGRSKSWVGAKRAELERSGLIRVNGHVEVIK